jgi:hypothetical protein
MVDNSAWGEELLGTAKDSLTFSGHYRYRKSIQSQLMKRRETILVVKVPAEENRALLHSTPSSDDFLPSAFSRAIYYRIRQFPTPRALLLALLSITSRSQGSSATTVDL